MIGQTLSHYRITAKLGEGGMGEVYRAEDSTLDREVALKILPPELAGSRERLERFQREAKTLAALDHPNIVTIHTVERADGIHFLTMQLVRGKPVSEVIPRAGMPLDKLFEIAIPLSEALVAAHAQGVVHRDLKPANVMVGDDGRVRVLDFGLAKLRQEAQAAVATELPTEALTEEGRIVGTMPYMSPEQLEGRELDARSDIFSFGIMLYEMATGERPFKGETSVSLISSIVKDTPSAVDLLREDLPHHLGRVISRCLEKDPTRRYQSAIDVRNELEALKRETEADAVSSTSSATVAAAPGPSYRWQWLAAAGALVVLVALGALWVSRDQEQQTVVAEEPAAPEAAEPMIAVLPFENLGAPEDEYFADGMTEEITSRLAMVSGLGVISRTSAMQYKEDRPALKQIGEELGVDYVLEGTVRWAKSPDGAGRVRITPQLIRVADDRHMWADNIERELEDIFAIQAEIAQQVIAELGVTLLATEDAALASRPTESLVAYEAYLRGIEALNDFEEKEAVRLFELAVEDDPEFVEAGAQLVITYSRLHAFGDTAEDWPAKSAALLTRVREVAPDNLDVRLASAVYTYYIEEDFSEALAEVELLVERHPNNVKLLKYVGYIARRLDRWEQSNEALERALRLDPRDTVSVQQLAANLGCLRRFSEAEVLLDRCLQMAPGNSRCYEDKGWNQLHWTGDTAAARRIAEQGPDGLGNTYLLTRLDYLDRDYPAALARLREFGQSDSGELYMQRIRFTTPYALGDLERARSVARELRPVFEDSVELQPRNYNDLGSLGLLYAVLGEKDLALATGERAVEIAEHDHFQRSFAWFLLAQTSVVVGEYEQAIEWAERVLASPGWSHETHHWYRLDPLWDPVRDDPRFQAILDKHAGSSE